MADPTPRRIAGFGWKRQLPDIRDHVFSVPRVAALPRHVDNHTLIGPVWDQGQAGSCTGHGTAAAIKYDHVKAGQVPRLYSPSRLMLYYDGRLIEGSEGSDAGANIRDVVAAAAAQGVCDEALWSYDLSILTIPPNAAAVADAAKHKVTNYAALAQDINAIKQTLASGYVFVFGFTVYQSFDSAQNGGLMLMPSGSVLGGHCVCAVGYNSKNYIMCRNSWGPGWGDPDYPGHFWMPANYITNPNLCSDFWIIRAIAT
jgi:C1A family cysteine protease